MLAHAGKPDGAAKSTAPSQSSEQACDLFNKHVNFTARNLTGMSSEERKVDVLARSGKTGAGC